MQDQTINEENINWLDEEIKNTERKNETSDSLPSLKFEENKIKEIVVDYSKPFRQWIDTEHKTIKKIIEVTDVEAGDRKLFWLNVKNPLYRELLLQLKQGMNRFRIIRTGNKEMTRYVIIK
jgi:hypothetical protein